MQKLCTQAMQNQFAYMELFSPWFLVHKLNSAALKCINKNIISTCLSSQCNGARIRMAFSSSMVAFLCLTALTAVSSRVVLEGHLELAGYVSLRTI